MHLGNGQSHFKDEQLGVENIRFSYIETNAALSLYMPSPADERSRLTIVTKNTTSTEA